MKFVIYTDIANVPTNQKPIPFDWPHAPIHRLNAAGTYIVTAGTYRKEPIFHSEERLDYLMKALFTLAREYGWELQAWAVFANHYHFVAVGERPETLQRMVQYLHSTSAKFVNRLDEAVGRKVWHQYWESRITYPKSFLARLNYVHTNPVKHGVVLEARQYPWRSAAWFERTAERSFYETVIGFSSDQVKLPDEFDVGAREEAV